MLNAQLKSIDVNGTWLRDYVPEDSSNYAVWITASIGIADNFAADLFQALVCSTSWTETSEGKSVRSGERYFEMAGEFDSDAIERMLSEFVNSCYGKDWQSLAHALSAKLHWEFEGYQM